MKMKLYGSYTSPFVRHCRIALQEEGLACEFCEADPAASARLSPLQRVPFLEYDDGGVTKRLTDSSAILKLVRESTGKKFLPGLEELNQFCAASTVLDTAINLFYMERDKVDVSAVPYLQRQQSRLQTGLADLDTLELPARPPYNDAQLRLACLLGWGVFRNRFSLDAYPRLQTFLQGISGYQPFIDTVPKA